MNQRTSSNGAVVISGVTSFFALLTVVFAAAKFLGFNDMSWIMVFSPIWGFVLVAVCTMLLIFCGATILEVRRVNILKKMKNKVDKK